MGAVAPGKQFSLNETHLGLIGLLFKVPRSSISFAIRSMVLSVFSNGLTHGYYCASASIAPPLTTP